MENITTKTDELVMRLLHYFITEQNYSPIVLHGAQNEIWLENLDSDYKIVRIVSEYIHNDEQLNFDIYKTKQIMKKIKRKTLSFKVNALSIFVNLNDNVKVDAIDNIICLDVKDIKDLKKYDFLEESFPDITNNNFKEKGFDLFIKLTSDINEKTENDANMAEDVFKKKKPIITYILIIINILMFLSLYVLGYGSNDNNTLLIFGANNGILVRAGQFYRLLTGAFLHAGVFHLLVNMYSLYIIGPQLESFYGKFKYLIIYLFSAIGASLLSLVFNENTIGVGASGAIFGLLGSLLYFGYHYRIYLGTVIKSQIIPLIIMNLLLGFMINGVDNFAHIGGLVTGILISIAVGVKYKTSDFERINGWILTFIYLFFTAFMVFLPR